MIILTSSIPCEPGSGFWVIYRQPKGHSQEASFSYNLRPISMEIETSVRGLLDSCRGSRPKVLASNRWAEAEPELRVHWRVGSLSGRGTHEDSEPSEPNNHDQCCGGKYCFNYNPRIYLGVGFLVRRDLEDNNCNHQLPRDLGAPKCGHGTECSRLHISTSGLAKVPIFTALQYFIGISLKRRLRCVFGNYPKS